ncbi:MAG: carbon-nitrogen hydrolase family protein [Candidatus Bathyarchaeia archaeon]|jgi:predicted amidohydrolase|nr:carbon-nitrogen hydrolase family protein [Candidatus Bathyarchaeota archaeon A05DMB-4]MDH7595881.1 carbon-nitrogen hydrolase family protein [Candidatus Bathyarchaeota archaeon]
MEKQIKIALAQISCKVGDKAYNIRKMATYITKAKKQKANLIIFPELSLTGYTTRDRTYELAETTTGPSTQKIETLAKQNDIHVIYGMIEKSPEAKAVLHNTAVLTTPKGTLGRCRKMYLPTHSVFEEKRYFRQGYESVVLDTSIGKIGLIICYDIFFPETARLLRLKGAELIVCISASPSVRRGFFETLTTARAMENTAYLAYVNLVGIEDGLQFWGGSRLIAPSGKIVTQAKYDEEDLVFGTIDYADLARAETFVPTLRDLRPELFTELQTLTEKL